jgi:L-arabinose isomerase
MKAFGDRTVWLVTGSQHLYGPRVLEQVLDNSKQVAAGLNDSAATSVRVIAKDVVTTPEEIISTCRAANSDENCIGLIIWMHTFSPAKMWIAGLTALDKPWLHLHTQFGAELPWSGIDMAYMNLNQSAHGDREFGYIGARLDLDRKVVVGHWQSDRLQRQVDDWMRAAMGRHEARHLKVARFGDNMRQVAVTEGDKVAAQIRFGYEVHAYGLGDLAAACDAVADSDIDTQIDLYGETYEIDPALLDDAESRKLVANEARLELGMRRFLEERGCNAFTNCFENLTGLTGLPGLATQRMMESGIGYGAEGDWKTAAMVRIVKVMSLGRSGGTSFIEDYTYDFTDPDQVLGAHMLEVCPSIAAAKPKLEIHPHTIGIKKDIARLVFAGRPGPALNISTIDLGSRFRIIVNELDTVAPPREMPNLPVAKVLWRPRPSLEVSAAAWIHAGGAHHSAYTQGVTTEQVEDFAEMCGVEVVVIDADSDIRTFKQTLRHNDAYFHLRRSF